MTSGAPPRRTGFLLYDNRSGSTFLSALLNRHRGVAVGMESDYVFQVLEHRPLPRTRAGAVALLRHLASHTRFGQLGIDTGEVLAALDEEGGYDAAAVLRAITRTFFESRDPDARIWIVKGPRLHVHLERLVEAFPGAFVIHLVRDGRAVFASKRRSISSGGGVMDEDLVHAAAAWRQKLVDSERFPDITYRVRYEDLVTDEESEVSALLDRLEVSAHERAVVKPREGFVRTIGASHKHLHTNVAAPSLPARAGAWRNDLSRRDILLYEMLNARTLRQFGYELVEHPNAGVARRALGRIRLLVLTGRSYLVRGAALVAGGGAARRRRAIAKLRARLGPAAGRGTG